MANNEMIMNTVANNETVNEAINTVAKKTDKTGAIMVGVGFVAGVGLVAGLHVVKTKIIEKHAKKAAKKDNKATEESEAK